MTPGAQEPQRVRGRNRAQWTGWESQEYACADREAVGFTRLNEDAAILQAALRRAARRSPAEYRATIQADLGRTYGPTADRRAPAPFSIAMRVRKLVGGPARVLSRLVHLGTQLESLQR